MTGPLARLMPCTKCRGTGPHRSREPRLTFRVPNFRSALSMRPMGRSTRGIASRCRGFFQRRPVVGGSVVGGSAIEIEPEQPLSNRVERERREGPTLCSGSTWRSRPSNRASVGQRTAASATTGSYPSRCCIHGSRRCSNWPRRYSITPISARSWSRSDDHAVSIASSITSGSLSRAAANGRRASASATSQKGLVAVLGTRAARRRRACPQTLP